MASNSETGTAVNISNYKLLIDTCTGYGTDYKPSNPALTITAMTAQWTAIAGFNKAYNDAVANATEPINQRQILFAPLDRIITSVMASLNSTNASKQVKLDVKGFADKIRGYGLGKKKDAPEGEFTSKSQQSYVQRAENFSKLLALLATVTDYAPNEDPIKIVTLEALYASLNAANNTIGGFLIAADNARIARDKGLYDEETGVVDISLKCKAYVKSVYRDNLAKYRMVSGIKFTRPRKKK